MYLDFVQSEATGEHLLLVEKTGSIYFESGADIAMFVEENKEITLFDYYSKDGVPVLVPKKTRRYKTMAEQKTDVSKLLDEAKEIMENEVVENEVVEEEVKTDSENTSGEFVEKEEKEKKDKGPSLAEQFEGLIKTEGKSSGVLPNTIDVQRFIIKHKGSVLGVVTNNDKHILAMGKAARVRDGAGFKLKSTASQESKEKNKTYQETGKGMPAMSDCVVERTLFLREKAPSPIRGFVISLPLGALEKYPEAIRKDEEEIRLVVDETKTQMITQLYGVKDVPQILAHLCGSELSESKETYGDSAGNVRVIFRAGHRVEKNNPGVKIPVTKSSISSTIKGRNLAVPGAYLPINLFETMSPAEATDPKKELILNESTFVSIVRGKNVTVQVTEKEVNDKNIDGALSNTYHEFVADSKAKVGVAWDRGLGREIITSTFFGPKAKETLSIESYLDKDVKIDNPVFPIKERRISDSKKVSYRYKRVDATKAEEGVMTSLTSPEFASFVEASDGALTVEALRKLAARASTPNKNVISNDVARHFLTGGADVYAGIEIKDVNLSTENIADDLIKSIVDLVD